MHSFFATAAKGTEGALRDELRALRLPRVRATRGGVHFSGTLEEGMRACLWSRIAMRILLSLDRLEARGKDGLYEAVRSIPWEEHLSLSRTFAVRATVRDSELTHSQFVSLRAKDAIVDRLRDKLGARPNVDAYKPDVLVILHLAKDVAEISLDLSGAPLHLRGWRVEAEEAPLRETLAAAMLRLGGYDPSLPFLDPMCGSGTIAIEAALFARNIAPGRGRHFGFQRWPSFGDDARASFQRLLNEAKELALRKAPAPILGSDHHRPSLEVAARNAQRAGVAADISFSRRDARELGDLPPACQIFSNPPYGERLGTRHLQLEGFYRGLGESLRALPKEHRVVLLSGSPSLAQAIGRPPSKKHFLFNGPLRVELLTYAP